MKLAAVVVLYHPAKNFIANLQSYYDYFDKLFVFDNTENESQIKQELLRLNKVEFFQNFKNEGIAKRLNEGAQKAIEQQFEWMLTMDQDSFFTNTAIQHYINCFNKYADKKNVAMFGIKYSRLEKESSAACRPVEIHELITSGTLVNLNLYKKIGNFDEALFIDSVDHDYSIRAKKNGFSIIEFSNIYLLHELGKQVYRSSIKTLFLFKKKKNIHTPVRCYYMYRNLLYLQKKYENEQIELLKSVRATAIGNITNCIYYGRNTGKIIKYLFAARNDFKKGKMGKI